MRHAMVGMGGVGGYFGAKLCDGGNEVHFLVRRDAAGLRERGLRVISTESPLHIHPLHVHDDVAAMPACDVVWVALKTVDNSRLEALLPPLTGPQTLVIMLQNGLDPEADAARVVGAHHVAGGPCLLMAAKTGPGEITHWGEGTMTLGLLPGPCPLWTRTRLQQAVQALERSGVGVATCDNLASARWRKLVWNVPFNGLGALLRANTRQIIESEPARERACVLMHEVMAVAAASGCPQDADLTETMLAFTRRMPDYDTSMKWDMEHGRRLEVEAMVERPIAVAHAHGVPVPGMEFLRDGLRFLSEV